MIDDVFAVIADPTRRQILSVLSHGKRPVGDLVSELGVSQPTVSKHLKVLRTAGLVETQAAGQKRFYSLTPAPLDKVMLWIENLTSADENPQTSEQTSSSPTSAIDTPHLPSQKTAPASTSDTPDAEISDAEPAPPATTAPSQSSEEAQEEPAEKTAIFDMGEEGTSYAPGQPRHSSRAIAFSPLRPFTPVPFKTLTDLEAERAQTGEETNKLPGESLAEKQPPSQISAPWTREIPAVEATLEEAPAPASSQDSEPEAKGSEAETTAPEAQDLPNPEATPEAEGQPEEGPFRELPALPSAAELDQANYQQEQKGLLATLSRWGRRRSR